MTGIIKTDKLQSSAGNDAVTVASNGSITTAGITSTTGTFSGNVGVGTSPSVPLHVDGAGDLIRAGSTSGQQISIGINTGGGQNYIYGSNHPIKFGINGTERLRILAAGGITFNGDTAAANALDDYEEGTWTPAMSTANVHHSQIGVYTKIGRMVSIQMAMDFTQGGTQFGSISGLPFTNSTVNYAPFSFREWYSTGTTMSSNLVIGSTTTNFIYSYANSRSATNNQRYGFAMSVTYIT